MGTFGQNSRFRHPRERGDSVTKKPTGLSLSVVPALADDYFSNHLFLTKE